MAERVKSSLIAFVSPLLSAVIALIGWSYIAGGKIKALEIGRDQNAAAIMEVRSVLREHMRDQQQVYDLLSAIDKRLAELQAEQRILHGRGR